MMLLSDILIDSVVDGTAVLWPQFSYIEISVNLRGSVSLLVRRLCFSPGYSWRCTCTAVVEKEKQAMYAAIERFVGKGWNGSGLFSPLQQDSHPGSYLSELLLFFCYNSSS
jgi:hypothetical protein